MDTKTLIGLAYRLNNDFYNDVANLTNDIKFFQEYMRRTKTSPFHFDVKPIANGTYKVFYDVWTKYGCHIDDLGIAYAEVILLKYITECVYADSKFEIETKQVIDFLDYFEKYENTMVENYVGDFIGCSRGIMSTINKIAELRKNAQ